MKKLLILTVILIGCGSAETVIPINGVYTVKVDQIESCNAATPTSFEGEMIVESFNSNIMNVPNQYKIKFGNQSWLVNVKDNKFIALQEKSYATLYFYGAFFNGSFEGILDFDHPDRVNAWKQELKACHNKYTVNAIKNQE